MADPDTVVGSAGGARTARRSRLVLVPPAHPTILDRKQDSLDTLLRRARNGRSAGVVPAMHVATGIGRMREGPHQPGALSFGTYRSFEPWVTGPGM